MYRSTLGLIGLALLGGSATARPLPTPTTDAPLTNTSSDTVREPQLRKTSGVSTTVMPYRAVSYGIDADYKDDNANLSSAKYLPWAASIPRLDITADPDDPTRRCLRIGTEAFAIAGLTYWFDFGNTLNRPRIAIAEAEVRPSVEVNLTGNPAESANPDVYPSRRFGILNVRVQTDTGSEERVQLAIQRVQNQNTVIVWSSGPDALMHPFNSVSFGDEQPIPMDQWTRIRMSVICQTTGPGTLLVEAWDESTGTWQTVMELAGQVIGDRIVDVHIMPRFGNAGGFGTCFYRRLAVLGAVPDELPRGTLSSSGHEMPFAWDVSTMRSSEPTLFVPNGPIFGATDEDPAHPGRVALRAIHHYDPGDYGVSENSGPVELSFAWSLDPTFGTVNGIVAGSTPNEDNLWISTAVLDDLPAGEQIYVRTRIRRPWLPNEAAGSWHEIATTGVINTPRYDVANENIRIVTGGCTASWPQSGIEAIPTVEGLLHGAHLFIHNDDVSYADNTNQRLENLITDEQSWRAEQARVFERNLTSSEWNRLLRRVPATLHPGDHGRSVPNGADEGTAMMTVEFHEPVRTATNLQMLADLLGIHRPVTAPDHAQMVSRYGFVGPWGDGFYADGQTPYGDRDWTQWSTRLGRDTIAAYIDDQRFRSKGEAESGIPSQAFDPAQKAWLAEQFARPHRIFVLTMNQQFDWNQASTKFGSGWSHIDIGNPDFLGTPQHPFTLLADKLWLIDAYLAAAPPNSLLMMICGDNHWYYRTGFDERESDPRLGAIVTTANLNSGAMTFKFTDVDAARWPNLVPDVRPGQRFQITREEWQHGRDQTGSDLDRAKYEAFTRQTLIDGWSQPPHAADVGGRHFVTFDIDETNASVRVRMWRCADGRVVLGDDATYVAPNSTSNLPSRFPSAATQRPLDTNGQTESRRPR